MSVIEAPPRVKVRKTITLDPDLVDTFANDDSESLSATINGILRAEQQRRAAALSIRQLADDLDALYGPADPVRVAEFAELLR